MKVLPLYLPHQGCTHQCVYCNQPLTVGTMQDNHNWQNRLTPLYSSTQNMSSTQTRQWEIAFYSGTFTALPKKVTDAYFHQTAKAKSCTSVIGYRISTRPDCVDNETLIYLQEKGVTTIELGVESLDDVVLRKSARGHSANDIRDACTRIQQMGFQLGMHLMCGLPGQSESSWRDTVQETLEIRPDCVRIAPTIVLKDTPLEKLYRRGDFQPLSLHDAVHQTAYAHQRFLYHDINVIRVGLALSDEEGCGEDKIVAGPWHPALRHEVESVLAFETITKAVQNMHAPNIRIHPKDISVVYGSKKSNLKKWKDNPITPNIQQDQTITRHRFAIENQPQQALFGIPTNTS